MSTMSTRAAAAWAMGSHYAAFAVQFATSVVLAHWYISPAELGEFTIAFAAVSLIAFLQDFGVNRYVTGERDLTPEKLNTAFTISVVFAWGIALIAILAAKPIAWFYGDPHLLPVTLVIACSYLLVPLAIVPQAMCQRRMDFRSNAMIDLGSSLANAGVAVTLAVMGYGALALAWGAFAQQAARLMVSQWRAGLMLPWPLRLKGAQPVLAIGGTNSFQVICQSIAVRAPELVIGRLLGEAALGFFARAAGLALQLRLLLADAVSKVFYPAFRRVRDSGAPLGPPYLRVVAAYTGVTWPAMAGIAVLAGPMIDILYGTHWHPAVPLLAWVAMAQLCFVAVPLYADLPILLGRMNEMLRRLALDTLASLVLLALAAPYGLAWIAASRLAHGVVFVAIYAPFMRAMIGFRWGDLLRIYAQSLAATAAAVIPLLASYLLWAGPDEMGPAQGLCGIAAGVACWLATLAALRHPLFGEIVALLGDARRALPWPPAARSTS
jgi:O-antigen/teichoic acid export membrane protein